MEILVLTLKQAPCSSLPRLSSPPSAAEYSWYIMPLQTPLHCQVYCACTLTLHLPSRYPPARSPTWSCNLCRLRLSHLSLPPWLLPLATDGTAPLLIWQDSFQHKNSPLSISLITMDCYVIRLVIPVANYQMLWFFAVSCLMHFSAPIVLSFEGPRSPSLCFLFSLSLRCSQRHCSQNWCFTGC